MEQNNPRAILLLQAAILAFLVGDSSLKLLLDHIPFWQLMWLRTFFSMLLLFLFVIMTGRTQQLKATQPLQHILRGLFLAAVSICYYISVQHFPLSAVATAFAGAPLVIAAISPWVLKEKATAIQWLSTAVGFLGVCLVLKPDLSEINWFYSVLLSLPFFYAILMLWSKRLSATQTDLALNFYSYIPLLIISSFFALDEWITLSSHQLFMLIISAAGAAAGFILLVAAFRIGKPVIIAPFEYTSIIMALAADMIIWKFVPDQWIWSGIAFIIICGLVQGYQARSSQPSVTPHLRPEDTHTP